MSAISTTTFFIGNNDTKNWSNLSGESHGQRSLAGYSPQGHKDWDMKAATTHTRPKSQSLSSAGKESICSAGDPGLIPGLGRSPGEGKGYPLPNSGLDRISGTV